MAVAETIDLQFQAVPEEAVVRVHPGSQGGRHRTREGTGQDEQVPGVRLRLRKRLA